MKFTPDKTNPKKVVIQPENDAERAWVSTLREGGKRVKRGSERYVICAFLEWKRSLKNQTKIEIDVEGMKAAMMGYAPATQSKADRKADAIASLKEEAKDAIEKFDDAMGFMCRETRGKLCRIANELHQRLRGIPFEFSDGTREDRAWEARDWLANNI